MSERFSGTVATTDGVVHYTCNAPDVSTLLGSGITPIGDRFNMEPREVVLIPLNLFAPQKHTGTVEAEKILRDLGK